MLLFTILLATSVASPPTVDVWLSRSALRRPVTVFAMDTEHCAVDPEAWDEPTYREDYEHLARYFSYPQEHTGPGNATLCCLNRRAALLFWRPSDYFPGKSIPVCAFGLPPETPFWWRARARSSPCWYRNVNDPANLPRCQRLIPPLESYKGFRPQDEPVPRRPDSTPARDPPPPASPP